MFRQSFSLVANNFYFGWFTLMLFFGGFAASALVSKMPVLAPIKAMPLWLMKIIVKYASPKRTLTEIFIFIAVFNSVGIFLYMISGVFVALPFIVALLTGLNIGVILQEPVPEEFKKEDPFEHEAGHLSYLSIFASILVPFCELFVFCVFVGVGMSMGVALGSNYSPFLAAVLVRERAFSYLMLGVPILVLAAALEAIAIKDLHNPK